MLTNMKITFVLFFLTLRDGCVLTIIMTFYKPLTKIYYHLEFGLSAGNFVFEYFLSGFHFQIIEI